MPGDASPAWCLTNAPQWGAPRPAPLSKPLTTLVTSQQCHEGQTGTNTGNHQGLIRAL